jgi:hypothetical protein
MNFSMERTFRKLFSTATTVNCFRTVHDFFTLDKLFLNTCLAVNQRFPKYYICERLRWSSGLWYPRSRVLTRPKPSDFSGEKIHSMPSFGGEVKPSVPCRRFAACKEPCDLPGSLNRRPDWPAISRPIPSFTDRGVSCRLTWSASGDDGRN